MEPQEKNSTAQFQKQAAPPAAPGFDRIDYTRLPLLHFAWPILVENILRVVLSSADVFMLSYYSEEAVAAVGLIFQLVFLMNLLYLMVTSGASILISQYLGSRNSVAASRAAQGSIVLSIIFSVLLSAVMCLCAKYIVGFYKLDPNVHKFAMQYMLIFSAGSVSVALSMALGTILRSYGYSREPMVVNIIAIVISVVCNYFFIFGTWGVPVLGVIGVALSTVFSQIVACVIMIAVLKKRRDISLPFAGLLKVPKTVYRQILSVGVPTAGENLSYNLGQIIIMRMVSSLGTEALAATVYALTVLRFVHVSSISIGIATQIKVGYYVGAGLAGEAKEKVYRYFLTGVAISLTLIVIVNLLQAPIVNIFTQNADVHRLIFGILMVALLLEPGRNFNVIIIPALKGAGDVRFPVYMGILFMWGIGVLLAYVFGIALGWGLIGIWIALTLDEWIRGAVMLLRWRGDRWKMKALVTG
ncbi:MAG: MATE family efflux transporter [Chitinispirillales bacterium]|jgi:putative MATE family efflux protein|nr:MATE family efflux transporter [Chitinispirillales bacterium]